MSDSPRAPHRLVALLVVNATLLVAFVVRLGQDLASRARIVSTDFAAYDTGWSLIVGGHGARLYDPDAQAAMQQRLLQPYVFPGRLMAFLNPPHVALAFAPLAAVPLVTGFRLWTALQLVLVIVLTRDVAALIRPRERLGSWVLLTAVAAFPPLTYSVQLGQMSVLLTLALLRLYVALEDEAPARAGFWLFVLGAKPQLLPLLVVCLACHRRWRALAWAAVFGLGAVALSSAVLGWRIWPSYLTSLPRLEAFFAQGTAKHMVTLRGLLVALGAPSSASTVAAWVALGASAVALTLAWRRREAPPVFARRFALATGLALALCPHLFLQDVTLWIVPLAVFTSSLAGSASAPAFERFALSWPLTFVGVMAYASGAGRSPVGLAFIPIALALVWFARVEPEATP